jgi:hypothetical protein
MDADAPGTPASESAATALARTIVAYRRLGDLGEQVADEWQYVNDLIGVHSADLGTVIGPDPVRVLTAADSRALDVLIEEIDRITDPHRAIDWLSTFPQVAAMALAPTSRP